MCFNLTATKRKAVDNLDAAAATRSCVNSFFFIPMISDEASLPCRVTIPSEVFLTVDNASCDINFLEHVQVEVDLDFSRRGDLYLELKAPSDTTSPLTRRRQFDNIIPIKNLTKWNIMTLFNWGESPKGQWKFKIGNLDPSFQSNGKYRHYCIYFVMTALICKPLHTEHSCL